MSDDFDVNVTVRARIYENNQPHLVEMSIAVPVNHEFTALELDALFSGNVLEAMLEQSLQNDVVAPAKAVVALTDLNVLCPRQRYCNKLRTDVPCAICHQAFKIPKYVRELPCKHLFCSACIEQWATQHSATCPVCRAELTTSDNEISG